MPLFSFGFLVGKGIRWDVSVFFMSRDEGCSHVSEKDRCKLKHELTRNPVVFESNPRNFSSQQNGTRSWKRGDCQAHIRRPLEVDLGKVEETFFLHECRWYLHARGAI